MASPSTSFIVHSRRTAVGVKYRVWSVEKGAYETGELSQVPLRRHLLTTGVSEDEADVAIRKALASGTSEPGKTRNQESDWEADKQATGPAQEPAKATA